MIHNFFALTIANQNTIMYFCISIIKNLGDINQFTPHIITLSILLLKKDISGIYLYSKIIEAASSGS